MKKDAFTLIEVMVSVMIITVVIASLLKMKSNNSYMLNSLKNQSNTKQYISLLIPNKDYGYENKETRLDALIKEFNVDDELRKKLKNLKVKIIYKKIISLDLSEVEDTGSSMVLEVGQNILKTDKFSTNIYRVKLQ
ncbi:MAG: prepilin-type N-terminal cleavage/methylation domain-containing protein [Campylobacterales bacterium]